MHAHHACKCVLHALTVGLPCALQADIKRFNEPTDAGKHWCWVHWDLDVNTAQFLTAPTRELLVRAWDSSQNGQPDKLTWNVMGMMNNCYFRVKIHPYVDAQVREGWLA